MISIIIPIYNVEKYLANCLRSVRQQTFSDIEILLIDDGSTDGSGKICDEICNVDNRFKVFHQENKGVAESRNLGLRNCKGEYISFIDGDDYVHPQMLEVLYKSLIEGDYSFSMGLYQNKNKYEEENGILKGKKINLNRDQLMKDLYGRSETKLYYRICCNKLYKRQLISDLLFKNTASEDFEFLNRIYLKTDKAIFIEDIIYYYIQNPNSITHKKYNKRNIDIISSYYMCLNEIPKEDIYYRGYCLNKLYKSLLSVRHYTRKNEFQEYADVKIKNVLTMTYNEFLKNKTIPLHMKILLWLFYRIPISYSLFLKMSELKGKIN